MTKDEIFTFYSMLATAKQHRGKENSSDLSEEMNKITIDKCCKWSS